jgi:hypothetical protein
MPNFMFKGGYPKYYPDSGLYVQPNEVYPLDSAPDADWVEAPDAAGGTLRPVEAPTKPAEAVSATPATQDSQTDLEAAEALLESNPELAKRLVEEAGAKNA